MAKSASTPEKARAASIARAERLQREAAARGDAPKQPKARPDRTRTPKGDRPAATRQAPHREGQQQQRSYAVPLDRPIVPFNAKRSAERRLERFRVDQEKSRQGRKNQSDRHRAHFNKKADRRQDWFTREYTNRLERQAQERAKAFTFKTQQQREAERKREAAQKAEQVRRDYNKVADRRQQDARRASAQRHADQAKASMQRAAMAQAERARQAQARAAASIEQTHKRQRADQQAAHRWQTAQVRTRHEAETRSLRDGQNQALERHHHAIIGIDNREREALGDFDARRSSLTGRIAEAVPGRRAANDEARAELVRGFESERLHKHRDLEALKERQFDLAQRTRISQAKERLDVARTHQGERLGLDHRQKTGRAAAVKLEARTIRRVDREQSLQASRVRNDFERERTWPVPGSKTA